MIMTMTVLGNSCSFCKGEHCDCSGQFKKDDLIYLLNAKVFYNVRRWQLI